MKYTTCLPIAFAIISFFSISCGKTVVETKIVNDTLVIHKEDTLVIHKEDTIVICSKDTTIPMDVNSWDCYSHNTTTLVSPGLATYFNTNEGIKFIGQGIRKGTRLQTKREFSIKDKTIYYKWKGNGGGQFAGFVIQLKYDPLSYDASNPPIQGVDFSTFSVTSTYNNSFLIQDDVWYYTRAKAMTGTDFYEVTTATGNYGNNGGNIIQTLVMPVYTKSGYLAIRIGDNYAGGNSYGVLGECRIASN